MTAEPPLLEVTGLRVRYSGGITGVERASLRVATGQVAGVVGPNGAGKTSLLRGIAGFPTRSEGHVSAGTVRLRGHDITGHNAMQIARAGVALVPERDKVFLGLTVLEHLKLAGRLAKSDATDVIERSMTVFPVLRRRAGQSAGQLSGGERQMLALGTALCAEPDLLLVDEASQGLAPSVVRALTDDLRRVADMNITVLLVEQNLSVATTLCDHLYVMEAGHFTAQGPPEQLVEEGALIRVYLAV